MRFSLSTPLFRRIVLSGVLAGLMTTIPGCYGTFPATSALYHWNGRATDNGIVNSIIMIVLVIIPVYGILMLVDAIILNSIEYWNGHPVSVSQTTELPDGSFMTLAPGATDNEAILTIKKDGITTVMRTYVRTDATHTNILDEGGSVLSVVERRPSGSLLIRDSAGREVGSYSRDQLDQLAHRAAPAR